jgi:hypothetical protein
MRDPVKTSGKRYYSFFYKLDIGLIGNPFVIHL